MAKRFDDAVRLTEKYKSVMQPCRYCQSNDIHVVSGRTIFFPHNVWFIMCDQCGDCTGDFTSVKQAIERWNSAEFRKEKK